MKPIIIYILIISLSIEACKKLYNDPPVQSNISSLVVECTITNDPPPYVVNLTQSIPYNSNLANPIVKYAKVSIIDEDGNIQNVIENPLGTYQTSPTGMQGKIGKSYKLKIALTNGKGQTLNTYESDWVKIPVPPTIDSIYAETGQIQTLVEQPDGTNSIETQWGINMFIDAKPYINQNYYYKVKSTMIQETTQAYYPNGRNALPAVLLKLYRWSTNKISLDNNLLFGTAQSNSQIRKSFIGFIPQFTSNIVADNNYDVPNTAGVIITANVYSLSKEIYQIFSEENLQTTPTNSIFDPIPTQLESNIKCTSNSSQSILGYFNAASVTHAYQYFMFPYYPKNIYSYKIVSLPSNIPNSGVDTTFAPGFWQSPISK